MSAGTKRESLPLLVVHPDFPWSGLATVPEGWTQEFCLPALRRIVAAARFRKRLGVSVLVIPTGCPKDWAGTREEETLLHDLAGCVTHLAPDRINAIGARRWLAEQGLPMTVLAAGFWRHHCVAEVRRAVPSLLSHRLTVPRP
jgi:hypothetical protein